MFLVYYLFCGTYYCLAGCYKCWEPKNRSVGTLQAVAAAAPAPGWVAAAGQGGL